MAGAEQGVRVRVAPDVEPADARNGSERAESVGNERVKTASRSQTCAARANRHVTKAAGLVSTPREPSLWRGFVVSTVLTPVTRSSDSLPCHAVTRLDRLLPRAVCIVDSEVSFCFVMIIICNKIMIVIVLIINSINHLPSPVLIYSHRTGISAYSYQQY